MIHDETAVILPESLAETSVSPVPERKNYSAGHEPGQPANPEFS